jgi:hypothetical protein
LKKPPLPKKSQENSIKASPATGVGERKQSENLMDEMISDLMMRRPSKRSITALNIASHSSLKRISQNKINEETSSILPSINNLGSNYSKD